MPCSVLYSNGTLHISIIIDSFYFHYLLSVYFTAYIIIIGLSVVTLEKALEINRISAKVGDNVEIRCDVSGNPPPPIVWKRYSADLTTLGDEDVRVFSDGSLYLTKIQLVHAGNYTCRALRNSEVTQTHVLTVHSMFNNNTIPS